MIEILADVHEQRSGIAEGLRAFGWKAQERHLEVSDYMLGRLIGVERKTVTDFVTSLTAGRLFRQLAELKASVSRSVLVVEGDRGELARLHHNVVRGVIIKIGVGWSVPILWSQDATETATLLHLLAQQALAAPKFLQPVSIQNTQSRKQKHPNKRAIQHRLLAQIPDIGPRNAAALLDRFESLEKVMAASPDTLREVRGIGTKKSTVLYDTLHEPDSVYRVG